MDNSHRRNSVIDPAGAGAYGPDTRSQLNTVRDQRKHEFLLFVFLSHASTIEQVSCIHIFLPPIHLFVLL